jgi:hypothetical protein
MDNFPNYTPKFGRTQRKMESLISVFNSSFKSHGTPKVLEFTAPIKTESFDDEVFLLCCFSP